jgi:tetratricopeptide (TPR) repeat protein
MGNPELERLLRDGIAAARSGQKEQARELLLQVIALDEEVEPAWLWLSGVVDDPKERRICLENVLDLNPSNTAAQKGLRWLSEQGDVLPPGQPASAYPRHPGTPGLVPVAVPSEPLPVARPGASPAEPPSPSQTLPRTVEIDPYGCPYCGGSVSGEEPRCDNCRRLVVVRYRKRGDGRAVGWLVLCFLLLGLTAGLEGYLVAQLVQVGQLPRWLSQTAVSFMVGPALFTAEGAGELADLGGLVTLVNYLLAGLYVAAAVGLALRNRIAYFGAFLLCGLMVIVTGVGLLTQLTGWLPFLFRVALVAITVKWLADSAPAFEWETRHYDADVDQDLRTDLDYHNRGQQYYDQRMWAKAAAHWKVASQLAPRRPQYRAELANAYVRMGYPAAALVEADRALAKAPDDEELRAFRDSLATMVLEGAH